MEEHVSADGESVTYRITRKDFREQPGVLALAYRAAADALDDVPGHGKRGAEYLREEAKALETPYLRKVARMIWARLPITVSGGRPAPPSGQQMLYDAYAVLCLAKGKEVTCEDVHNAWTLYSMETAGEGRHKAQVQFRELDGETRALDVPYRDAIRQVAVELPFHLCPVENPLTLFSDVDRDGRPA